MKYPIDIRRRGIDEDYLFVTISNIEEAGDENDADAWNFTKEKLGSGVDTIDWDNAGDLWGGIIDICILDPDYDEIRYGTTKIGYGITMAIDQFTTEKLRKIEELGDKSDINDRRR